MQEKAKQLYKTAFNESGYEIRITWPKQQSQTTERKHAIIFDLVELIAKSLKQILKKHSWS